MKVKMHELKGVTDEVANALKTHEVHESDKFLAAAGHPKERTALAAKLGIHEKEVLELANRADLARIKGIGVACVTYCVGGLNMLNSVACAYAEKSPLIVISGGPSQKDRQADPLLHHKVRTFDTQRRIFEEVTCATTVLLDPETAASEIIRVVHHGVGSPLRKNH